MDLVGRLAAVVTDLARDRQRVLVGIDGPDAAGKTVLAGRLADAVPVPTLRATIDDFHHPKDVRYRRGELSADGYYRDSFDCATFLGGCLTPFVEGDSRVQLVAYDNRAAAPHKVFAKDVPARAVLVVDGVFLLRAPLRELWTLSVYLRVSPGESLRRAAARDRDLFDGRGEIVQRYLGRYLPGQVLYRDEVHPESHAHVVVDNERVESPVITRWRIPAYGRR